MEKKWDTPSATLTTKMYILFISYNHWCSILNDLRSMYFAGSISLLVDHFLDLFHDSILHKMQATMIINELMMGAVGEGGRVSNDQCHSCLVLYVMLPLLSGVVCCKCCMVPHVYVAMLNGVICYHVVCWYMLSCCMVTHVAMLNSVTVICCHVVWEYMLPCCMVSCMLPCCMV